MIILSKAKGARFFGYFIYYEVYKNITFQKNNKNIWSVLLSQ